MTQFRMKLAGVPIGVEAIYPTTMRYCRDYLTDEEPDVTVSVEQEDIDREREKSAQEDIAQGLPVKNFPDNYLEILALYRKIVAALLDHDVFLFHGSVVAVDNEAYIFTAKSGTGKTTHTRLWLKNIPGSYVVNGDKPLIKITDSGCMACATPWQGKEGYGTNVIVPLKAICVLERDKDNHIEEISPQQAFPMLYQQAYRPSGTGELIKTLELLDRLGRSVKLYRLGCNMEDEAALCSYNGMKD